MDDRCDPVTLEVVKHALASIGDEMALVIMRSAYSPVVRDTMDYSTALMDAAGRMVAQGLTLAVQLGSFPDVMAHLRAQFGGDMAAGDVFVCNDPYGAGGQHLPDIYVIKPLFAGDALVGFAGTIAHHADVGGIAPGSVAIHATEIFQEGLRLPIVKLVEAGRPARAVFRIIERNSRNPVHLMGDLRAQIAACEAGERAFLGLVARHGPARIAVYLDALQEQAERLMRAEIARIPDGTYRFTDFIDGLGEHPEPLPIAVAVEVAGDRLRIDFSGTAAQVAGAINAPVAMARSASYCAVRCIGAADIPNCEGYMRAIELQVPEGSILNPRLPAACGARGVMGYRVFEAIMGALAQAIPERVIAACEGGPTLFSIGGYHRGAPFTLTEVMVGTWGARHDLDGLEGVSNPAANLSNQPVELIEAEYPIEIVRYGLVPDTGGAGRQRGGMAFERAFRLRAGQAVFTTRSDRRRHRPFGLAGGGAGAASRNLLTGADGSTAELPTMPMQSYAMAAGDCFHHVSAGGGGFGPAFERAPEAVAADVREGLVSVAAAARDYGVAIDAAGGVDAAATAALRGVARMAVAVVVRDGP